MQPVIGLEIHIQLKTNSKLFCSCSTASFGAPPNTNICPICTGQPGVLPVLNKNAVEQVMRIAAAAGSTVNPRSVFARKNYFYPDLPKNYQISQYEKPVVSGGAIEYYSGGEKKSCRLTRVHLEEDAGKLLHAIGSESLDYSLVDYNRAGTPLGEMVTEPEIENSQQASDFLTALRTLLRSCGASNCDMEKGEMRVDVNVSLRKPDGSFGTRVEIKNLNSFKSVRDALEHEIARQKEVLESGGKIIQETRLWDTKNSRTVSMRSKEESSDYRYFPDPDLLPLQPDAEWAARIKEARAALPHEKIGLYQEKYGLSLKEAQAILFNEDTGVGSLFDGSIAILEPKTGTGSVKTAANWILNDLMGALKSQGKSVEDSGITAARLAGFVDAIQTKKLSSKIAKDVFAKLLDDPKASASEIIEKSGVSVMSNEADLLAIVKQVITEKAKIAEDYKGGKDSAVQALIGAVMQKTKGQAHPQTVKDLFHKELRGA